ncbi:MAG: hypothetical protein GXO37_05820 [Chloroflexi bacterium]|nr:hypothetical protein [Chloroflexota bacterium]
MAQDFFPQPMPWWRRGCGWLLSLAVLALLVLLLVAWGRAAWQAETWRAPSPTPTPAFTSTPTPSPTASATPTATFTPSPTATPLPPLPTAAPPALDPAQGLLVFALQDGPRVQLFAYHPQRARWVRLTQHPHDHLYPRAVEGGRNLLLTANPNREWDLYYLDLTTGRTARLTREPGYQAAAALSPDGVWMVYEGYTEDGHLDLFLRQVRGIQDTPLRLTHDPAADYAPDWSAQGRLIAFVSTRGGTPQVWVADLDRPEVERFHQVSDPEAGLVVGPPHWSPNGRYLAWAQTQAGLAQIYVWDALQPDRAPTILGEGHEARWMPDGEQLAVLVRRPERDFFTLYRWPAGLALPLIPLPGRAYGWAVGVTGLAEPLPETFARAARLTPTPLWVPVSVHPDDVPEGRTVTVPIPGVDAPYPYLSDSADEAFQALRAAARERLGWDPLAGPLTLFTPFTDPQAIPLEHNWLSTGRAFALDPAWLDTGDMVVVREDYGPATYWRVYLRAHNEGEGRPLRGLPWDFAARLDPRDPRVYTEGGAWAPTPPPGQWVDFTALAEAYGWERLPALPYWRGYLPAARFNLFVLREGLSWEEAMAQIYPERVWTVPEWLAPATPTPTVTPTATP